MMKSTDTLMNVWLASQVFTCLRGTVCGWELASHHVEETPSSKKKESNSGINGKEEWAKIIIWKVLGKFFIE